MMMTMTCRTACWMRGKEVPTSKGSTATKEEDLDDISDHAAKLKAMEKEDDEETWMMTNNTRTTKT